MVAADINSDGAPDFVLLRDDGTVIRLSDKNEGTAWDVADIVKTDPGESHTLLIADLDNNGSLDLLVGDGHIFLGGAKGFRELPVKANIASPSVVDLNGDGLLDLVGLSPSGEPSALLTHSQKHYHWQDIRVRASQASSDQRINSFGIGGEVEIRSGKQSRAVPGIPRDIPQDTLLLPSLAAMKENASFS